MRNLINLYIFLFCIFIGDSGFAKEFRSDTLMMKWGELKYPHKHKKEVKSDNELLEEYKSIIDTSVSEAKKLIQQHKDEALALGNKSLNVVSSGTKVDKNFLDVSRKLVFVSFSQSTSSLENIIKMAKVYGFVPVMRGFKNGSYIETSKFLTKIIERTGYGIVIDPEAFTEFNVDVVPTYVISEAKTVCHYNQTCLPSNFHKVSGNLTFDYVLHLFKDKGWK